MKIITECPTCGAERELSREEVISGRWRKLPCPVCQPSPEAIAAGTVAPDTAGETMT